MSVVEEIDVEKEERDASEDLIASKQADYEQEVADCKNNSYWSIKDQIRDDCVLNGPIDDEPFILAELFQREKIE